MVGTTWVAQVAVHRTMVQTVANTAFQDFIQTTVVVDQTVTTVGSNNGFQKAQV